MDDQTSIPQDDANQIEKKALTALEWTLARYNKILKTKEKLKIEYVLDKMDRAYYGMWRADSNTIFRRAVMLKHRHAVIRKGGRQ